MPAFDHSDALCRHNPELWDDTTRVTQVWSRADRAQHVVELAHGAPQPNVSFISSSTCSEVIVPLTLSETQPFLGFRTRSLTGFSTMMVAELRRMRPREETEYKPLVRAIGAQTSACGVNLTVVIRRHHWVAVPTSRRHASACR